ncbi:hypothetical protein E2F46_14580 [Luteimonas aestuarii]|uniref:Uncharacterized protein n=1 Tax=Luteimonas aestuarii TaxID=453837 RepID=A0A4R5TQ84_9GAMM|nr:hypothetical protein [Luteimonas aestuarii]TDK21761.1 hypothetical protein E2F46_14580 [Luteimonas aestuarii]
MLIASLPLHAVAQDAPPANEAGTDGAATGDLGTVRVIGVYEPPADPFALENPVDYAATRFQRDWREPPSLEEIGMRGGIVHIAINQGLLMAAQQVTKLPGWKHQVQGATARPPPLDEEEAQRAMRVRQTLSP